MHQQHSRLMNSKHNSAIFTQKEILKINLYRSTEEIARFKTQVWFS